jgi:hypothetical protein
LSTLASASAERGAVRRRRAAVAWRRLRRNSLSLAALGAIVAIILLALAARSSRLTTRRAAATLRRRAGHRLGPTFTDVISFAHRLGRARRPWWLRRDRDGVTTGCVRRAGGRGGLCTSVSAWSIRSWRFAFILAM